MHSTVTKKGQTTIAGAIRQALRIQPGDRLQYEIDGDQVTFRRHPGVMALKGALASNRGKNLTFAEIRKAAASERLRQHLNR